MYKPNPIPLEVIDSFHIQNLDRMFVENKYDINTCVGADAPLLYVVKNFPKHHEFACNRVSSHRCRK